MPALNSRALACLPPGTRDLPPAWRWLADRQVQRLEIEWKEDVRVWHPGQAWIWEPGGMGVFDPGINALSIVTAILPQPFFLQRALLLVPSNAQTPIAADLSFTDPQDAAIEAAFDFRQTGPQIWDIHVNSDGSRLSLTQGDDRRRVYHRRRRARIPRALRAFCRAGGKR